MKKAMIIFGVILAGAALDTLLSPPWHVTSWMIGIATGLICEAVLASKQGGES